VAEYHQVLHCMGVFSHTAVETPSFYTDDDDDDEHDQQVAHSTLTCCGFATQTTDEQFTANKHTTTGQSNSTKRLNCRRTWMVQSHSPGRTNVHRDLTHASLDTTESTSQMSHLDRLEPFLHSSRQRIPIFYNRPALSPPSKLLLHSGGNLDPI